MYLCSIGSREEGVRCPRIAFTTGSANPGIVSMFFLCFIFFYQFWDVSISIRIRTGAWVDFVSMFNSLFVSLNVLFFKTPKSVCVCVVVSNILFCFHLFSFHNFTCGCNLRCCLGSHSLSQTSHRPHPSLCVCQISSFVNIQKNTLRPHQWRREWQCSLSWTRSAPTP